MQVRPLTWSKLITNVDRVTWTEYIDPFILADLKKEYSQLSVRHATQSLAIKSKQNLFDS